ncbi:perlucin [Biomphalaria glabrata]|nr:perlucin [Biomphalaria glabrata]
MSDIEEKTDNHERIFKLFVSVVEQDINNVNLTLQDNLTKLSKELDLLKIDFTDYVKTLEINNLNSFYKQVHNDILSINQTLQNSTDSLKVKYEKEIDNHKKMFENAKKEIDDISSYKTTFQSQIDKLVQQNNQLSNENTNLKQLFTHLEGEIRHMKEKDNKMRRVHAIFNVSNSLYGRRYYLTKDTLFYNVTVAQAICLEHGGYLAEMDDVDEFIFVQDFLSSNDYCGWSTAIMIGGTDEDHEGRWVHISSKTPVVKEFWGYWQPGGGREENCQAFKACNYLHDYSCYLTSASRKFLCEVPE